MKNSLFIIALLVVASVSCDSGRTIPSVETGNEKATSLTFEDTVRFHTQKYCNCFGEFNVFVEKAKTMHPDSVDKSFQFGSSFYLVPILNVFFLVYFFFNSKNVLSIDK